MVRSGAFPATGHHREMMNPSSPTDAAANDRAITSLAMALFAVCLGYAIQINNGNYGYWPIVWLTISAVLCCVAVLAPPGLESFSFRALPLALAIGTAFEAVLLLDEMLADSQIFLAILVIAILAFLQFFDLRGLRLPLMLIMAVAFVFAGQVAFNRHAKNPGIDVFSFQMDASYALRHGLNPYEFRYPNVYPPDTPYYGRGVVDAQGYLTFGFPYPPLSALMVLPAYLIGGDVRYAHAIAMGLSAVLMAMGRPGRVGRIGALTAAVFLLTPRAIYVLDLSWTEPLLALTFSIAMLCACRWPKALPYALGLYFSTKQYTVLALPLLPLLAHGSDRGKSIRDTLIKAGLVVMAINLPFFLWSPEAFARSLVVFQFRQPFRLDALSYLVFVYRHAGGLKLPIWISLAAVIPAVAIGLYRAVYSPAGFAAALTLVQLAFFAFNKQAFCNYYYFVIATACWSVAAAKLPSCLAPAQPVGSVMAEAHVPRSSSR
jgi:hypothetical protein